MIVHEDRLKTHKLLDLSYHAGFGHYVRGRKVHNAKKGAVVAQECNGLGFKTKKKAAAALLRIKAS